MLRRLFDLIVVIANGAASGWIFVMMALITTDIFLRFVFGAPISGVTEIVEISIVIIVYLQLTHTLKVGRMTRSDALYSSILRRFPPVGHIMNILFSLAGIGLMIAIVKGGWPKWIQALAIQFALMALDNIRGLMGKPPLEHEEAVDVEVAVIEETLK
jgi:TRAP-type C4-dicarboxylate transport system permease small subunit